MKALRRDWLIAAFLAFMTVMDVLVSKTSPPVDAIWASAATIALLPWRRRIPLTAGIAACVAYLALQVPHWGHGVTAGFTQTFLPTLFLLTFAMCRWSRPVPLTFGGSIVLATTIVAGLGEGKSVEDAVLFALNPLILVIIPALALRHRARLVEQQIEQHTAQARLGERHELARELHDLVAHHVSAIAVTAQAAQVVDDTHTARSALRSIERTASTALLDLRRLVGILRNDDATTPASLAVRWSTLLDADGTPPVRFVGDVDPAALPAPVAGAVYRIARESITNARRHSRYATSVDVALRRHPRHVEVTIVNDGVPRPRGNRGFGLVGMRERVEAFGGDFTAGPESAGGWAVRATFPVETAEIIPGASL